MRTASARRVAVRQRLAMRKTLRGRRNRLQNLRLAIGEVRDVLLRTHALHLTLRDLVETILHLIDSHSHLLHLALADHELLVVASFGTLAALQQRSDLVVLG